MFKNKKINYKGFILPVFCMLLLSVVFFANDVVIAKDPGNSFTSPLTTTSVEGLLTSIMSTLKNIIASIAVLMIIIGGIMYMTSAGDQGRVELAKKTVTYAVIGLVLVVAAPSILGEIYKALGSNDTPSAVSGGKTFFQIINSVISTLVGIIGSLSILMLIIAGIMYMTSGGDDSRAETAKNTIKYAIIGLVVSILSYVIVKFVAGMF